MKKTIKILSITIFTLVLGFNISKLMSKFENKNELALSSLVSLQTANASDPEGQKEPCTDVEKFYTSRHGFTSIAGDDCNDSKGKKCGTAYSCQEDTNLPQLPDNQFVVCNKTKCHNAF